MSNASGFFLDQGNVGPVYALEICSITVEILTQVCQVRLDSHPESLEVAQRKTIWPNAVSAPSSEVTFFFISMMSVHCSYVLYQFVHSISMH